MAVILVMAGCADTKTQESNVAADKQAWGDGESAVQESATVDGMSKTVETEAVFKEDSFIWEYKGENTGIVIPLTNCICEYDSESFRIYSKYLDHSTWGKSSFRYYGKVLYLQTPQNSMQLLADDYIINQENGRIYVLFEDEEASLISMYEYWVETASGEASISGAKILTPFLVEEWFLDAYQIEAEETQSAFSKLKVSLTDLVYEQGAAVLQGEASGIYRMTGEKYDIDWTLNSKTGDEIITPCMLRIYDAKKDREVFEACDEAFDKLEQGDWSVVAPFDGKERLAENDIWKWRREDVNGDNLPELISLYAYKEDNILPIERIFAYVGGTKEPVELVYKDLNDYSEFLFLGSNGNIIYDYSDHGQMQYGAYSQYQFDVRWKKKLLYELEIYYFYEEDYYSDEEIAWYKESFPNMYGKDGGGYYYFQTRPKTAEELRDNEEDTYWVKEAVTKEAFEEAYQNMTGFSFFAENTDF